jgi:hypothetical protein
VAQDVPDWQKTVKIVSSGGGPLPGADVPDWQKVVKVVTTANAGQDWPDWQRTIIGPGGANPCPGGNFDNYIGSLSPTYWWKQGESSGTVAADSADSNTGAYEGAYTLGQAGLVGGDLAVLYTSAGTSPAWIETSIEAAAPTTAYSIMSIFNLTDVSPLNVPLISFNVNQSPVGAPDGASDRALYIDSSGGFDFYFYNGRALSLTAGPLAGGAWHMAVATLGPAGTFLYLDGEEVASSVNTGDVAYDGYWIVGGAVFSRSFPGYTGAISQDWYMNGLLQHTAVWDGVQLIDEQVNYAWSLT